MDQRRYYFSTRDLLMMAALAALGKVDALAVSMEGRCFGKYPATGHCRLGG